MDEATAWFQKSLDWKENEDAAFGIAIAAKQLHDVKTYRDIIARYGNTYQKVAELEVAHRSPFISLLPDDVLAQHLHKNVAGAGK